MLVLLHIFPGASHRAGVRGLGFGKARRPREDSDSGGPESGLGSAVHSQLCGPGPATLPARTCFPLCKDHVQLARA